MGNGVLYQYKRWKGEKSCRGEGKGRDFCLRQAQAERMAMRTAPIVWAEESPLVRPQAQAPATGIRRLLEGDAGGNEGKTQGGLPKGNPVCLWQTELFKLNLKSSPSSSGYNRRRRLAPRSSRKQQAERTAVRAAPIVCPEESPQCARRRIPPPCGYADSPKGVQGGRAESPPACNDRRQLCRKQIPLVGTDAPTPV